MVNIPHMNGTGGTQHPNEEGENRRLPLPNA